jgi:aquaporin Z
MVTDGPGHARAADSSGGVEGLTSYAEQRVVSIFEDFQDPSQEWRRLFSELLGTFFLVLVAAGGGMMGQAFPNTISRTAAVVAPGLMVMAIILFMGKVAGAQNLGVFGALGVGGYIALAGLWGSPISGTSMNPARTFGPDLVSADFSSYWVYVAGPLVGAVIAVGFAFVLRGRGGGLAGSGAAQGALFTESEHPDQR